MKPHWRRILLAAGIVVILSGLYAWFLGFQTMMVMETRSMAKRAPVVRMTPRSLPDTAISQTTGTRLSYFGYQFEVPWDDLDESRSKSDRNYAVLHFRSGSVVVFKSLPPREFVNSILQQLNRDSFRQVYGDAPLRSDLAMYQLIFRATPDQVTLLSHRKETVGIPMLLLIKAIAVPQASDIYSIQAGGFQGFQYGNPEAQPGRIVADLFADDGGVELIFSGPGKGHPLGISQAEINRVLQTVHKTGEKSSESDTLVQAETAR